jgi:hypothetical protein
MGNIHVNSQKESLPAGFFYPSKASDASRLLAQSYSEDLKLDLYFRRRPYCARIMSADLSHEERLHLLTHWEHRSSERLVQGRKRREVSPQSAACRVVRVRVHALPRAATGNISAVRCAALGALGRALRQLDTADGRSWELRLDYNEGANTLRTRLGAGGVAGAVRIFQDSVDDS